MIPTTRGSLFNCLNDGKAELAWEEFLEAYQPLLYNWARRFDHNGTECEELLAEIYLHLLPRLKNFTYNPQKRFRGWLKQVVYSAIAKYGEKKQRQLGVACDSKLLEEFVPSEWCDELADEIDVNLSERLKQADAIVAKVKKRVKPENWQAFLFTYVEGMECAEAAEKLDMPIGAVHVARCRVRAILFREGEKALHAEIPSERPVG